MDPASHIASLPPGPHPDSSWAVHAVTTRIADGDEEAFRSFYDRYCDRLFRYALVLTRGDESQSRELLQTALTKSVRAFRPFADEAHLWNWLAAILRNSFLDAVRRRSRAPQIIPLWADDSTEFLAPAPPPDDAPLLGALERSLEGLEPEDRAVIDDFYFQQTSQATMAAQRSTSIKAIESRLGRIRQKLRQTILHYLKHEHS